MGKKKRLILQQWGQLSLAMAPRKTAEALMHGVNVTVQTKPGPISFQPRIKNTDILETKGLILQT